MKKIESITKGVENESMPKFKEQRILNALSMAKLNAEEQLAVAKMELESLSTVAATMSPERIIQTISDKLGAMELAQMTLERLKKVEEYLNSED